MARYIMLARHRPGFWRLAETTKMAGAAGSESDLDVRRRKLLFRAWHRGMREVDLIMGRFADYEIAKWGIEELEAFEHLLEMADRELLAWVTGEAEVPRRLDTALFRRLRDFNRQGCGAR